MGWFKRKNTIADIDKYVETIEEIVEKRGPEPQLEYVTVYYNAVVNFSTDRPTYTMQLAFSYVTLDSWMALSRWEMQAIGYSIGYACYIKNVGRSTAISNAKKEVQRLTTEGVWVDGEFVSPNCITGCTLTKEETVKEITDG